MLMLIDLKSRRLNIMTTCNQCGDELEIGSWPFCKGTGSHGQGVNSIIPDDIPGGVLIRHGLMDPVTLEPVRYYSKSAVAKEAKARGLTPMVRHVGREGGDTSK